MASAFAFIALLEICIIGSMALAQTDRDQFAMEGASEQTVKIGAIYNQVGSQSPLDLPSARGAGLAVDEINRLGGIDGKEIELILCDGKSDTANVGECAKALIAENVSAIIGLSLSSRTNHICRGDTFCHIRGNFSQTGRGE